MTREDIKMMLCVAIGIALIIIAIKFFVKLLPYIIIAFILMLVYDSYKRYKFRKRREKNDVEEAVIIKEKNNN